MSTTLTLAEIKDLHRLFVEDSDGDTEETEVTILRNDGDAIAYYTDYPDEGHIPLAPKPEVPK
jgi:hypothetical protein